jgi:hypothetical protein
VIEGERHASDPFFPNPALEVIADALYTPIVEKVDKLVSSAFFAFKFLSGAKEAFAENRRDKQSESTRCFQSKYL